VPSATACNPQAKEVSMKDMRLYYTLELEKHTFIIYWDGKHDDKLLENLNHALGGMADKEDIEQAFERLISTRDAFVAIEMLGTLLFGLCSDQSPLIQTDDFQQNEG